MTNGGTALPRLDCPSEGHRREGADQNGQFRVRDARGHRAEVPGRWQEGRCDHLGLLGSMAAAGTRSSALFTCDSVFSTQGSQLVGSPAQTDFLFSPALEGCTTYAIVWSRIVYRYVRCVLCPSWCAVAELCVLRRDAGSKTGACVPGDDVWSGVVNDWCP